MEHSCWLPHTAQMLYTLVAEREMRQLIMMLSGFHLENFPWGGSSLGSNCYVSYTWSIASFSMVPSLACGAVTSLACHE